MNCTVFFNIDNDKHTHDQIIAFKILLIVSMIESTNYNQTYRRRLKKYHSSVFFVWLLIISTQYECFEHFTILDYTTLLTFLSGLGLITVSKHNFNVKYIFFVGMSYTFSIFELYIDAYILTCILLDCFYFRNTKSFKALIVLYPFLYVVFGGFKNAVYINFFIGLYDYYETSIDMNFKQAYFVTLLYIYAYYNL